VAVVWEGRVGPKHDQIRQLCISPDGQHIRYMCLDDSSSSWSAVLDQDVERTGVSSNEMDRPEQGFKFQPHVRKSGSASVAVVDDKAVGAEYASILGLVAWGEPRDRHYAFIGTKQSGGSVLVVDGKELTELANMSHWKRGWLHFSPDHSRVAVFGGDDNSDTLLIDGKPVPKSPWASFNGFSPDGKHFTYWAGTMEKRRLVGDGWDSPDIAVPSGVMYDGGIVWSPDSSTAVVWVPSGSKRVMMLNGQLSREYDDAIYGGPSFREDGTLEFLGIHDGAIWRVTLPPAGKAQ
jgi:hypothetical protein